MDISIGKFTLESLTTGMYNEPETCLREYIQNAVDSIDKAVELGLLQLDESRIEIIIDDKRKEISIKDNGCGIKSKKAQKTLLDIGNSSKLHSFNRGFRGIGRLGGLSYCKKLSFCTTFSGEEVKTEVTFDCEKLKELLVPGQGDESTLQSVIAAVTEISFSEEQKASHYFIVSMEDVDDISSLMDIDIVREYISQVAPVPFQKAFYWSTAIKEEMQKKGVTIEEYPIFIGKSFNRLKQVFKPYKTTQEVSLRPGVTKDEITGLSFFDVVDSENVPLAFGWYADTEYLGTIADSSISGIRVRLGNILIGDAKTLSSYFKEPRFNGWVLGELYIVSKKLIPNARRDDFERNEEFNAFEIGVRLTVGKEVSDKIRAASKARNNPSAKTIKKAEKTVSQVETILTTGFNSSYEKKQIADGITAMKKELHTIPKSAPGEIVKKKVKLIQELEKLEDSVSQSKNFRAKKGVSSNFSKDEKKMLQAMLEVLTRNFARETVDSLYQEFLEEIKGKRRM